MKTAHQLYKEEKEVISELFELGLISDVERIAKNIRNEYLYKTQLKDSE